MNRFFRRGAFAVALLAGIGLTGVHAQIFNPGEGQTHDEVTGLLCVTPSCDVVRLDTPEVRCVCQKLNPTERRLSQLQLQCSTTERGRWVQCPAPLPWER
jgi:hypothetical protein